MKAVRIIKRSKNEDLTGVQAGQDEITTPHSTREIMRTVKGWIAELHRRRRDEQLASSAFRKVQVTLSLVMLFFWGLGTESDAQQLRDVFRRVEQAVVTIRTEQKGLAPFPQQGMVSLNGLASGVLISNDGKVLTAAHLGQAADRTCLRQILRLAQSKTVWQGCCWIESERNDDDESLFERTKNSRSVDLGLFIRRRLKDWERFQEGHRLRSRGRTACGRESGWT